MFQLSEKAARPEIDKRTENEPAEQKLAENVQPFDNPRAGHGRV